MKSTYMMPHRAEQGTIKTRVIPLAASTADEGGREPQVWGDDLLIGGILLGFVVSIGLAGWLLLFGRAEHIGYRVQATGQRATDTEATETTTAQIETSPPIAPTVTPNPPGKRPGRESGAVQPTQETNAVSTNSPHHGTTSIYALDVDAAPQQENANALTDEELADIPSSESPEKVRAAMPSKKGSSGTRNSVEKYRQSQVSK